VAGGAELDAVHGRRCRTTWTRAARPEPAWSSARRPPPRPSRAVREPLARAAQRRRPVAGWRGPARPEVVARVDRHAAGRSSGQPAAAFVSDQALGWGCSGPCGGPHRDRRRAGPRSSTETRTVRLHRTGRAPVGSRSTSRRGDRARYVAPGFGRFAQRRCARQRELARWRRLAIMWAHSCLGVMFHI
jgi:hypothetical protein